MHAGKAAELLCTRFEVVLGQAGPNHEAAVAGAVAALDKLNGSLQLRSEVWPVCHPWCLREREMPHSLLSFPLIKILQ